MGMEKSYQTESTQQAIDRQKDVFNVTAGMLQEQMPSADISFEGLDGGGPEGLAQLFSSVKDKTVLLNSLGNLKNEEWDQYKKEVEELETTVTQEMLNKLPINSQVHFTFILAAAKKHLESHFKAKTGMASN